MLNYAIILLFVLSGCLNGLFLNFFLENTMFLKKYLLISSVLLAIGACSKQEETQNTTPVPNTAATTPSMTYRVGTDFTYAPYNQRTQNGGITGLDIDIMNAIAKNQNFQVEYVALEWDSLMKSAKTQNLSVVMDGIAADDLTDYPDYVLSQSYMRSGDCIYVAKPENSSNWHKQTVATHLDDFLDEELIKVHGVGKSKIEHIRTLLQGFQYLAADKVQAVVSDCGALRHVAKNPLFKDYTFYESKLPNSELPETADLGFGVLKSDTELLNKINTGLQNIKQSGELDAIIKKWN